MADGDIRKANIGPNDAVLADFRLSFEEGKGIPGPYHDPP